MGIPEDKSKIRRALRQILEEIPREEHVQSAAELHHQLEQVVGPGPLMGFLPLSNEIDISGFLASRLPYGVAVPSVDWSSRTMIAVQLDSLEPETLETDDFGIRTPRRIIPVPLDSIATILVPALGFDRAGHRLGRGGGFYDRLLANRPAERRIIGVCYSQQVIESIPIEPWDQTVDLVVTPDAIIDPAC